MTTIRKELESRLKTFADAQIPLVPIAYEGVNFQKPQAAPFIECFVVPAPTKNITTDGIRSRETGTFAVNVWYPTGAGTNKIETLADGIRSAFPIIPKTGTVSIESTPSVGKIMTDVAGWLILPVTISYRQEIAL